MSENDKAACDGSDAIINLIRGFAEQSSKGETLSENERKKLLEMSVGILRTSVLDTIQAASKLK